MGRSITSSWTRRVRKRAASLPMGDDASRLDLALAAISDRLQIDASILLGVLAADPPPTMLWAEVERAGKSDHGDHARDWTELSSAARMIAEREGSDPLSCWVADADPMDSFALASALLFAAPRRDLVVLATNTDPIVAEIARTALLSETAMRLAPTENRRAHFRRLGGCWRAAPALRAIVRFERVAPNYDGFDPGSAERFDLVVCRGRLSRLSRPAAERHVGRLLRAIRTSGFLLVGPGDHDTPALANLERCVVPGALLYRKRRMNCAAEKHADFEELIAAVEADPTSWEPRWRLACELLRAGYAESALSHLRDAARRHPGEACLWESLAQAYTLLNDQPAAAHALRQAGQGTLVSNAA